MCVGSHGGKDPNTRGHIDGNTEASTARED